MNGPFHTCDKGGHVRLLTQVSLRRMPPPRLEGPALQSFRPTLSYTRSLGARFLHRTSPAVCVMVTSPNAAFTLAHIASLYMVAQQSPSVRA